MLRCHHCSTGEPTLRDKETGHLFCCRDHYVAFGTKYEETETPDSFKYTEPDLADVVSLEEKVRNETVVRLNGVKVRFTPLDINVSITKRENVFPEDIMLLCRALDITSGVDKDALYVPRIGLDFDTSGVENPFLKQASFGSLIRHRLQTRGTDKVLPTPFLSYLYNKRSYTLVTPGTIDRVFNLMSILAYPMSWSTEGWHSPFVVALTTRLREAHLEHYAKKSEVKKPIKDFDIDDDQANPLYTEKGIRAYTRYRDENGSSTREWPIYKAPMGKYRFNEEKMATILKHLKKEEKKYLATKDNAPPVFRYYDKGNAHHFLFTMMKDGVIPGELINYIKKNLSWTQIHLYLISLRNYATTHLFPQVIHHREWVMPYTDSREVFLKETRMYVFRQPANTMKWKESVQEYTTTVTLEEKGGENAGQDQKIVSYAPFVDNLVDESKVSIVIFEQDATNGPKKETMQGYVTCSLLRLDEGIPFKLETTTNETLQNITAFSQTNLSESAFYHILHIDGLHVLKNSRSMGAAGLLIYHALRFIDSAASDLGVTLVTCHAVSYPTYAILRDFGFTHYNERTAINWILVNIANIRKLADKVVPDTEAIRKKVETFNDELLLIRNTYMKQDSDGHYATLHKHNRDIKQAIYHTNETASLVERVKDADELFVSIKKTLKAIKRSHKTAKESGKKQESMQIEKFIENMREQTGVSGITCLLYLDNKVDSPFKTALAKLEKEIALDTSSTQKNKRTEEGEEAKGREKKRIKQSAKYSATLLESLSLF